MVTREHLFPFLIRRDGETNNSSNRCGEDYSHVIQPVRKPILFSICKKTQILSGAAGLFSFGQNRPRKTWIGRMFAAAIRVDLLNPLDLRFIALPTGKLHDPAGDAAHGKYF